MEGLLYIIYMYVGSQFTECKPVSTFAEARLHSYYSDMKTKNRQKFEDMIADFTDNVLSDKIEDNIWECKAQATFGSNWVKFDTGLETLSVFYFNNKFNFKLELTGEDE